METTKGLSVKDMMSRSAKTWSTCKTKIHFMYPLILGKSKVLNKLKHLYLQILPSDAIEKWSDAKQKYIFYIWTETHLFITNEKLIFVN